MELFQKQLNKLRQHVHVEKSTQSPSDPYHQPMFVEGLMDRGIATPSFMMTLHRQSWSYEFLDFDKEIRVAHKCPDSDKKRLLFQMLQWEKHGGGSATTAFPEWMLSFRTDALRTSFLDAWGRLDEEDHKRLEEWMDLHGISRKNVEKEKDDDEFPEMILYEKEGVDMVQLQRDICSGKLLYFYIENLHDPTDRGLYEKLLKILNHHHGPTPSTEPSD